MGWEEVQEGLGLVGWKEVQAGMGLVHGRRFKQGRVSGGVGRGSSRDGSGVWKEVQGVDEVADTGELLWRMTVLRERGSYC